MFTKSLKSRFILGVDPGSQKTGYGLIELSESKMKAHKMGVIQSKADSFNARVLSIGQDFGLMLNEFKPDFIVVEKIFLAKNADSAFKLGHARGVLIYQALSRKIEVYELATRQVKKMVAGSGAADKNQVQKSLQYLLKIPQSVFDSMPLDASDALALAYAMGLELQKNFLIEQQSRRFSGEAKI